MLENYAYLAITQSEGTLVLAWIGLMTAGVILGLIFRTGATLTVNRMPYLVWMGATYFVLSMVPLMWLLTFEAMERQLLWVLVAIVFGSPLLYGIICGVLSHARSVSAYGDGIRGFYALIPILNLFLMFKRPIDMEHGGFGESMRNFVGVIIGIGLMGLGGVMDYMVAEQTDAMALEVEFNEGKQATSTEMMVQALGLEEALRQIASETPGQSIDDQTILMGVRSEGAVLSYFYQMETDEVRLPDHMRMEIAQYNCDYVPLYPVIKAGGTIEDVYMREDGVELGRVSVTRESCSF